MDYKKMWYELKESLMKDKNCMDASIVASSIRALDKMSDIEVKEYKMVSSEESEENGPNDTYPCNGGSEQKSNEGAENECKTGEKPDAKDILKEIFGDDFVCDIETLEKKIMHGNDHIIMVDGNMDIPEHLMKLAREKNINIGQAHCGVIKKGSGFPLPFPFYPGIMK